MVSDVIKLIKQAITTDKYQREVATETSTNVFCEVNSITQTEFYAAANTELNPEYRFNVFFGDYNGESIVEYQSTRYSVYRTYRNGDYMELYVERKIGT